jgi:cell wall-associated NlpC family hydrolase
MILLKKNIVQITFLFFILNQPLSVNAGTNPDEIKDPYLRLAAQIENYSKKFIHTKYEWGGKKPGGFDCSGLVRFCFKKIGIELTQSSTDLEKLGYEIPPMGALAGDLIFFKRSSNANSPVSHVGIILEANENGVKFIHAARNQGVIISYLHEDYYTSHFKSVKRVIDGLKNYKY